MRIAILPGLWILVAIGLFLASLSLAGAGSGFLTRSWQSEDGLPSNVVRTVAQAADGYLWVGTAEGVVRFDGQRFTQLTPDPGARSAWRSTKVLFPLANGEVWVTTASNILLRGRGARLEQVHLPPAKEEGIAAIVSQVFLGGSGEVFVVRGEEVWRITGNAAAPAERSSALDRLLQKDAAAETERGRTERGSPAVKLREAGGALWEFLPESGLILRKPDANPELVPLPVELSSAIQAMHQDREGNLWLATQTQGLWQLRPSRVEMLTTEHGLSDRTAMLVLEDRAGTLWIAPVSGGLDCFRSDSMQHFDFGSPVRRRLSALLETRAGVLWVATRDARVYHWKDGVFTPAFPVDRRVEKVLAMTEDHRGRIWLGGQNGLAVWDGIEIRSIDFAQPESVTVVASDGTSIWVGTDSGKVFRGSDENFESVGAADSFEGQPISNLLPDQDGAIWIGTMGAGLHRFKNGRVQALAGLMPEADARITCLLDDGAGLLWMGTLGGICRVQKAKLLGSTAEFADATVVLDRSDGLLTRECTRGGEPAGWRGRDGTLYFATGNGVARVKPEKLTLNKIPPPVVIEGARIGGQAANLNAGRLQVGPGRTRMEFRFTALTFSAPEKARFRTQLEGLDETWREATTQRIATYDMVPPGQYRFRVLAENGDGVWNETGATLALKVLPHFWETRWFRVMATLCAVALAVSVGALVMKARLRERLLRLEAQTSREKERARIAQDLHDELGASLTEISLLASLAAEESHTSSKEDNTLPEVATKAQALVGALDEIVWAVNPRHDTIRSLAEYLASFGGTFLGRAGMTLRRDVPRDLPEVSLDAERRHNIFLAAREAFNNVVKHSGASEVWLRVRMEREQLKIAIEDNGHGGVTGAQDELNEGLRGMRARMETIGGTCHIESDSSGTRIVLSIGTGAQSRLET